MKRTVLVGFGALTFMALIMAPVCALAVDWDLYGSARVKAFYMDKDKEANTNDRANSDMDLDMDLATNSRIGANVKVSDAVAGRFEYGASGGDANIRLLYGDWNFGTGTIRLGQDYTPMSPSISNQVFFTDDNLNSVGAVDGDRFAQIKLIMGSLQVALVENAGSVSDNLLGPGVSTDGYETDKILPKIEASYEFAIDMLSIMPFVGFQTYDIETTGATQSSETVTSYVMGVHGMVNLGPAYVNFSGHIAQNGGDYGLFSLGSATSARLVNNSVEDSTGYGMAVVGGFKPSDTLQVEAGIGYVDAEVDTGPGTSLDDDTLAFYVNAVITLAPGVYVVPEIGFYDDYADVDSDTDLDDGRLIYAGAKFQIDF